MIPAEVLPLRRRRALAVALGLAVVLTAAGAVVAVVALGWSFDRAVDRFVISNVAIGVSFGLAGAVVARHRPDVPLGWLHAAAGLCHTTTALGLPLAEVLRDADAPEGLTRLVLTAAQWAWPLSVGVAIPLSLLLLPDGRLASARWRPVALVVVATGPLFVLQVGLEPDAFPDLPRPYLAHAGYADLAPLWTLAEVRELLVLLVGVACLVVRYRRGDEEVRRQLLWVVAATAVVLVAVTPWALVAGTPVAVLFAIPLLPLAVVVAVLRHRLLDIRLVLARGVTYALLSGLVLAGYAGLVAVLATEVVSAVAVALLALPVRSRLQRAVDGLLYGERADPVRLASRVGHQLPRGLAGTLEEVRTALRLPGLRLEVPGAPSAVTGDLSGPTAALALPEADLVVALRSGERRLAAADERALRLLAGPLTLAARATRLTEELQASRERLVTAREEERRRLRRDLHDGLGPLLTGVALSADAAQNLAGDVPAAAASLLGSVRSDVRSAIGEVRRIVDDLGPPALDGLGLVAALQVRVDATVRRADGRPLSVVLEAPPSLPPLPSAVEVAAYRVATEALTNAVRHAAATRVVVRLSCDDALVVHVEDDGGGGTRWEAGVGLSGMRERAAELGGDCAAGPGPAGGSVRVRLPLVPA